LEIPEQVVEVNAFTIDKKIIRKELSKEVNRAIKSDLLLSLSSSDVEIPSWVIDRVQAFTSFLYPFIKTSKTKKSPLDPNAKSAYVVNDLAETPEEIADKTQKLYAAMEHELKNRKDIHIAGGDEQDVQEKGTKDEEVRKIVERVEKSICEVFYDR
jgi:hypothetical protein